MHYSTERIPASSATTGQHGTFATGLPSRLRYLAVSLSMLCYLYLGVATAQAPVIADLMEAAVHAQHIEDDPGKAIELYQQVVQGEHVTPEQAAEALYNMALGYRRLGRTADAHRALEAIDSRYRHVEPYHRLAQALLNPVFEPLPAPWDHGERLEYEVGLNNVSEPATRYFVTTLRVEHGGMPAWKVVNRSVANNGMSMVIVDDDTYRPLFSVASNPMLGGLRAEAVWTADRLDVTFSRSGETRSFEFDRPVYDAEQLYALIRQIPFSPGHRVTIDLQSIIVSNQPEPLEIEVNGEETIEVPAGRFETYRLSDKTGLHAFWVSSALPHYLVKMSSPTSSMQLAAITRVHPDDPTAARSAAFDVGFSFPGEWYLSTTTEEEFLAAATHGDRETFERIELLDPDGHARMRLNFRDRNTPASQHDRDASLEQHVASMTDAVRRFLRTFSVKEDTKASTLINGLPAMSYVAEYANRALDETWVYYATGVEIDDGFVWIAAMCAQRDFDRYKPKFDAIIGTLKPL